MDVAKKFKIQVQKDHLSKVASGKPKTGLSELIWNAFDADAKQVQVLFIDGAFGIDKVRISDNGEGIPYGEAEKLFVGLGGSWKSTEYKTKSGRYLHGQEGQGRFKAFTIGRVVDWHVVYKENGKFYEYTIAGFAEKIDEFSLSPRKESNKRQTGVSVEISEINDQFQSLDYERAAKQLAPIFALYLRNYSQASLSIGSEKILPESVIENVSSMELEPIASDGHLYPVKIEIVEWVGLSDKEIWFADSNGFPLESYDKQVRGIGDQGFSAYLRSDYFRQLHNRGLLSLRDLEQSISDCCDSAIAAVKGYFLDKALSEAKGQIEEWKRENIYPYSKLETVSQVESAERKIFDIVAVNINSSLPDFKDANRKTKQFQLRMLKHAIEKSPEDLQIIMTEVLNLSKSTREQLTELLKDTSLSSIISASKEVSDRIKFLSGLDLLVYEYKKHVKERTQLHRLLAKNTWVFGDSFTLSVDDQSLTEVLRKHKQFLNDDIVINEPVKRLDGRVGIVDLMLSRQVPRNRPEELEHLVVELKKPDVVIGQKEIEQIKSYAHAVAKDERFRSLKTKWDFWVISNDYDDYAEMELDNDAYENGVIYKTSKKVDITIWIKTWSELFADNRHRLEFLKNKLDFNVDKEDAIEYLKSTYAQYVEEPLSKAG